jgi:hypothetical protein
MIRLKLSSELFSKQAIKTWCSIITICICTGAFTSFNRVTDVTTVFYVASNGNDSNDGTSLDSPLATITKAADRVKPGDTVIGSRRQIQYRTNHKN